MVRRLCVQAQRLDSIHPESILVQERSEPESEPEKEFDGALADLFHGAFLRGDSFLAARLVCVSGGRRNAARRRANRVVETQRVRLRALVSRRYQRSQQTGHAFGIPEQTLRCGRVRLSGRFVFDEIRFEARKRVFCLRKRVWRAKDHLYGERTRRQARRQHRNVLQLRASHDCVLQGNQTVEMVSQESLFERTPRKTLDDGGSLQHDRRFVFESTL